METPIQAAPDAPKKSNIGLIIGIVVVVLLCCCCLIALGGIAYARYQANSTISNINNQLSTPGTMPSVPGTGGSGLGTNTNIPGIPSGGKGDDVQRSSAWAFLLTSAAMDGCTTSGNIKADSTKINVTQQPDSSGAWQEEWTVTCDSGSPKTYVVAFPSGDANAANIKVTAK